MDGKFHVHSAGGWRLFINGEEVTDFDLVAMEVGMDTRTKVTVRFFGGVTLLDPGGRAIINTDMGTSDPTP